jgi:hypothetical protein
MPPVTIVSDPVPRVPVTCRVSLELRQASQIYLKREELILNRRIAQSGAHSCAGSAACILLAVLRASSSALLISLADAKFVG